MFSRFQSSSSLRRSLVFWAAAGGSLVLCLSLIVSHTLTRMRLEEQFDIATVERLETLVGKSGFMIHPETGVPIFVNMFKEMGIRAFRTLEQNEVSPLIQVRDLEGITLYRSSVLAADGSDLHFPDRMGVYDWMRWKGTPYRVVTVELKLTERFITDTLLGKKRPIDKYDPIAIAEILRTNTALAAEIAGAPKIALVNTPSPLVVVAFARPASDLSETLFNLALVLGGVGCVSLLVMILTLRRIVIYQLRPLSVLAEEIDRIDDGKIDQRIARPLPEELKPAADRLNELLDHLAVSMDRERAFSSDLAHEFKTPLAGIRAKIDLARFRERRAENYRQTLDDCLDISREMEATVESMLTLARLEGGKLKTGMREIALRGAIDSIWLNYQDRAEEKNLNVAFEIQAGMSLYCDATLLRIILRNLLENAVIHSGDGTTLTLAASMDADLRRISLSNGGSRLNQAEAERACERFWRGDTARSATGQHCGLGLSLVKQAVKLLGGTIAISSERDGDFRVELNFKNDPDKAMES
jgi:signal transduction histidine kinase